MRSISKRNVQTRLDKAQSEAVHWESKWTHIQNTAAKKTLLLGRIKIATHNLYQLVARHAKHDQEEDDVEEAAGTAGGVSDGKGKMDGKETRKPSANLANAAGSTEQTAQQLDRIQNFIQDLTQICADIRKQETSAVL